MKIRENKSRCREWTYEQIEFGQAFRIKGQSEIYLKIPPATHTVNYVNVNAVHLESGNLHQMFANVRVIPLDGEFVYTEMKE